MTSCIQYGYRVLNNGEANECRQIYFLSTDGFSAMEAFKPVSVDTLATIKSKVLRVPINFE